MAQVVEKTATHARTRSKRELEAQSAEQQDTEWLRLDSTRTISGKHCEWNRRERASLRSQQRGIRVRKYGEQPIPKLRFHDARDGYLPGSSSSNLRSLDLSRNQLNPNGSHKTCIFQATNANIDRFDAVKNTVFVQGAKKSLQPLPDVAHESF